jgi:hypothetical protein
MTILQRPFGSRRAVDARARLFGRLAAEVGAFVQAVLAPGKLIEEVEQMRALHLAAARIEPRNAARAAWLRSRASRTGLR